MPSRVSRGSLIFVGFVLACLALMVVVILSDRTRGLSYVMTFEDARGLTVGAPVMLRGTVIGEVVGVRLSPQPDERVEVTVRIYGEHAGRIAAPPDSTGRIKRDSLVLGNPYIEILTRGQNGQPLQEGTVVAGLENWTEEKLWAGKGRLASGYTRALEMGKGGLTKLEDWAESEQGQKVRAEVDEFFVKLDEVSSDTSRAAREKLDAAVRKGGELVRRLKEEKASDVATDLRQSLDRLIEESEGLQDDARERLKNLLDGAPDSGS